MIAVYTANISSNDPLREPLVVADDVDYIYFTNRNFNQSTAWDIRKVKSSGNPKLQSRWFFDQSCLVLPEYEYTVMHGANSQLTINPRVLIDSYLIDTDIAAFRHPHRDCIYNEGSVCKTYGKDSCDVINQQMNHYGRQGYPRHNGLSACILLVRRNTPELAAFETRWFEEVSRFSHRDQLSFDYVRWLMGMPVTYIPGDPFQSPIMAIHKH